MTRSTKRPAPSFSFLLIAAAVLAAPAAAHELPAARVDRETGGAWRSAYGSCGWVLSAYNVPEHPCLVPLLPGTDTCDPSTCPDDGPVWDCTPGVPEGGATLDLTDCASELRPSSDAAADLTYDVYAGPAGLSGVRVLREPDGACADSHGEWQGGTCDESDGADTLTWELAGLPAGDWRLSVHVLAPDAELRQELTACVGGDCSGAVDPGEHSAGVHVPFDLHVETGDVVTITHRSTAGGAPVVSGAFLDPLGAPPACGDACALGAGSEDRITRGDWPGRYGEAGHVLFHRGDVGGDCLPGDLADGALIGGFDADVTVRPLGGARGGTTPHDTETCAAAATDGTRPPGSSLALGHVWECAPDDPRALEPAPCDGETANCAVDGGVVAASWDDGGIFHDDGGPDLFVDVEVDRAGTWDLTLHAVDFGFEPGERRQRYRILRQGTTDDVGEPVDLGTFAEGAYVTWTLEGPFAVTIEVDRYAGPSAVVSGLFLDRIDAPCEEDDGGDDPPPPPDDCPDGCTFTIGGWSSSASGNNPGSIRDAHWDEVYPEGLTIGDPDCFTLHFSEAATVERFLPCGSTPASLDASFVDPECAEVDTVLASQTLALRMNVDYSCAGVLRTGDDEPAGCLRDRRVSQGAFAGSTVGEVLAACEAALACGAPEGGPTLSEHSDAAAAINQELVDCEAGEGFLECSDDPPTGDDCGLVVRHEVSAAQDLDGDGRAPDVRTSRSLELGITVTAIGCDVSDVVVVQELDRFEVQGVSLPAFFPSPELARFSPDGGKSVAHDEATSTLAWTLGDLSAGATARVELPARLSLLAPIGTRQCSHAVAQGAGGGEAVIGSDDACVHVLPLPAATLRPAETGTGGSWCRALQEGRVENVEELLESVVLASRWHDESVPASSDAEARAVLCAEGFDPATAAGRQLLGLLLDLALGATWSDLRLEQLCNDESELPASADPEWSVADVLVLTEQAFIDGADEAALTERLGWLRHVVGAKPPSDPDGDGVNGLQDDPVEPFDARFDALPCDGCASFADAGQEDSDGDGIGDACGEITWGDVAPRGAPDGRVDIGDVVRLLRMSVAIEDVPPGELVRANVAPAWMDEGDPPRATPMRGGRPVIDIADVVLALRMSVHLVEPAQAR